MTCCVYKSGFQCSGKNPIFIITLKRRRVRSTGRILFHPVKLSSQMARYHERHHKKRKWVVACLCKCLILRPFFSILGTLEWEVDCWRHLDLFTTPASGSLSYICLLWPVLERWQGNSSYKETKYRYCLNEGGIQWFLLDTKERISWS